AGAPALRRGLLPVARRAAWVARRSPRLRCRRSPRAGSRCGVECAGDRAFRRDACRLGSCLVPCPASPGRPGRILMADLLFIAEPRRTPDPEATGFALWRLGFRPFYLLASAFGALSVA